MHSIRMIKYAHDHQQVSYRIEIDYAGALDESQLPKQRCRQQTASGVFSFHLETHDLVFDPALTDPLLLDRFPDIPIICLVHMRKQLAAAAFPDRTCWASG